MYRIGTRSRPIHVPKALNSSLCNAQERLKSDSEEAVTYSETSYLWQEISNFKQIKVLLIFPI